MANLYLIEKQKIVNSMVFSVLLSLYYKENPEFLKICLESIINQTLQSSEVIIVEDGPLTIELYSILEEYQSLIPNFLRVPLSENVGLGNALDHGLKYCNNELIIRMDTDDICFPDRFEKQVKFMTDHPEVDVCSSWIEEFEGNIENVKSLKKVPETHEEISQYIGKRNPMNHPAVIFRKSAVLKAGGYRHFPLFEDWYLWARMFVNGARFGNIPEPLLHFRISSQMFKRRGGMRYAIDSTKFQWELHKLGIISTFDAVKSSIMRGTVYLLPNKIRTYIYTHLLRS